MQGSISSQFTHLRQLAEDAADQDQYTDSTLNRDPKPWCCQMSYHVFSPIDRDHAGVKSSDYSGTAGDLTVGAQHTVIDALVSHGILTRGSQVLDIGAGFGKPLLHMFYYVGCTGIGIEHDRMRHFLALKAMKAAYDKVR